MKLVNVYEMKQTKKSTEIFPKTNLYKRMCNAKSQKRSTKKG